MKSTVLILLLGLLIYSSSISGQSFINKLNDMPASLSFKQKAAAINKFFDTATLFNRSMYKQWKRWEWFMNHHLNSNDELENYYKRNLQVAETDTRLTQINAPQLLAANSGSWVSVGHAGTTTHTDFSFQGRVNCIAFDPVNAAVVYAGAAGGGIWKSTDFGNNWFSISDNLPTLSIASIAVNPSNSNIIYAISGEGLGFNSYFHYGIGIIKSIDGGLKWQRTNLSNNLSDQRGGFKLLIHPTDPNTIFAAMSNGLWRSQDGGNSWIRLLNDSNDSVNDIEFKPGDPNTLYYTKPNSTIFYRYNLSTLSVSYTTLAFPIPPTRIEIGVTPANPNAVYIVAGPSYSSPAGCPIGVGAVPRYNGLYYSNNGGSTFTLKNNDIDIFGMCKDQSDYDIAIHVSPINENDVFIAGIRLYRSLDGGTTVSLANDPTNSVHHDCHAIERNPLNFNLYVGNDGGVQRSTTNGASWNNSSSNLLINEYYRISGIQSNASLILGGTQDNGLFVRNNNSNIFYTPNILLDFMDNIIDFTDANIMYACNQDGGLHKSTNGGLSFSAIIIPGGGGNWITPIVQAPTPASHNTIFYGSKTGILRTTNGGASWINTGGQLNADCMAIGTDGTNFRLYTTASRFVSVCDNPAAATPVWTVLASPNTNNISAIAVNPANKNEVWITCGGYTNGQKIFRSVNGGVNWVNIGLSLPNIPVYAVAFANNNNNPTGAVYIGTELGVFYKDDNLADWEPFYNGLPMVPVTDLQVNYNSNIIYAATYGRGIWYSDLFNPCIDFLNLTNSVIGNKAYQTSNEIQSLQTVAGSIGNELRLKAGQIIRLKPGFLVTAGGRLHAGIGPCGSGILSLNLQGGNPPDSSTTEKIKPGAETPIKKED